MLLGCIACQKSDASYPIDTPKLEADKNRLYLLADGSAMQQLKISSNISWTISGSGNNWLKTSVKTGNGSGTIIISADRNDDSLPRYERLILSASNASMQPITIYICQGGTAEQDISGNIPDPDFRRFCVANYGCQGKLTASQASFFDGYMNIGSKNIHSLAGIEYFTSVTGLICSNNPLSHIDVSHNPSLTVLFCDNTNTTSLDISANRSLVSLSCRNNKLSELDLSENTHVQTLDCSYNLLSDLNLKNGAELTSVDCSYNQLTALNLAPQQPYLQKIICNNNSLAALDVSHTIGLSQLDCSNNKLTTLNIVKNERLETFDTRRNDIRTIYVWPAFDINNPPKNFYKDNATEYRVY